MIAQNGNLNKLTLYSLETSPCCITCSSLQGINHAMQLPCCPRRRVFATRIQLNVSEGPFNFGGGPGSSGGIPEPEPEAECEEAEGGHVTSVPKRYHWRRRGQRYLKKAPAPPPAPAACWLAGDCLRIYVVWRVPDNSQVEGLWISCGSAAWRSLVKELPHCRYQYSDGTRLKAVDSWAEAWRCWWTGPEPHHTSLPTVWSLDLNSTSYRPS